MTDKPKRRTNEQLEILLTQAQKKIAFLEEELRIERYRKFIEARRASYGNGAHQ